MLKGDLTSTPLAPLLLELADDAATGCLHIDDGADEALVYFKNGLIYSVSVPGTRPQLGAKLVSSGALAPEALAEALEAQRTELQGWRLGELLVHLGYVDQPVVEAFVKEQVSEAIWDLLRWTEGTWKFRKNVKAREDVGPPMAVVDLLETLRERGYEWETISAIVHGPTAVPRLSTRGDTAAETTLDNDAWSMLCKIDGERSVADLARDCGYTLFEAGNVIVSLVQAGLVDIDEEIDLDSTELYGATTLSSALSGALDVEEPAPPADDDEDAVSRLARLVNEVAGHHGEEAASDAAVATADIPEQATAPDEPAPNVRENRTLTHFNQESFAAAIARVSSALSDVLGDAPPTATEPSESRALRRREEQSEDPEWERRKRLRSAAAAELANAQALIDTLRETGGDAASDFGGFRKRVRVEPEPAADAAPMQPEAPDPAAAEQAAAEEAAQAQAEAERIAAEQAEAERLAAEQAAAEEAARLEAERLAAEQAAAEEAARAEAERLAAERAAAEQAAADAAAAEQAEAERLAREEAERLAAEVAAAEEVAWAEYWQREEAEREAAEAERKRLEAEEAERLAAEAAERAEAERLAAEAEAARLAAEEAERQAEEERLRQQAEEFERHAREEAARVEAERQAAEEEAARLAAAEADRLAAELAAEEERQRIEAERLAAELAAEEERQRIEAERLAAEAEAERLAAEEAAEAERLAALAEAEEAARREDEAAAAAALLAEFAASEAAALADDDVVTPMPEDDVVEAEVLEPVAAGTHWAEPDHDGADTAALLRELSSLGGEEPREATPPAPPARPRPTAAPEKKQKKKIGLFGL
jgi:hypothetical protein